GYELGLLIVNLLVAVFVGDLLAEDLFDLDDHLSELNGNGFVAFLLGRLERFLEELTLLFRKAHTTGELLRVADDTFDARGDFQRIVLHIFTGTTEDRVEQLLLGGEFRLALGRNLADQDIARL